MDNFEIKVKRAENGAYVASCDQIPMLHTEGLTIEDVLRRLADGYALLMNYVPVTQR
jgi:predicted RNase H-like HicB family nuclease